jgi:hypothetical protein
MSFFSLFSFFVSNLLTTSGDSDLPEMHAMFVEFVDHRNRMRKQVQQNISSFALRRPSSSTSEELEEMAEFLALELDSLTAKAHQHKQHIAQ